jgi:hypothetical protein
LRKCYFPPEEAIILSLSFWVSSGPGREAITQKGRFTNRPYAEEHPSKVSGRGMQARLDGINDQIKKLGFAGVDIDPGMDPARSTQPTKIDQNFPRALLSTPAPGAE